MYVSVSRSHYLSIYLSVYLYMYTYLRAYICILVFVFIFTCKTMYKQTEKLLQMELAKLVIISIHNM